MFSFLGGRGLRIGFSEGSCFFWVLYGARVRSVLVGLDLLHPSPTRMFLDLTSLAGFGSGGSDFG